MNGFDQLTRLAQAKRYRETAQSLLVSCCFFFDDAIARLRKTVLQAIKQLQAHFKSYAAIERISTLFKGIHDVQAVLRDQVMADFKAAFVHFTGLLLKHAKTLMFSFASGEPGKLSRNMTLMDACLVVDALGDDARQAKMHYLSQRANLQSCLSK